MSPAELGQSWGYRGGREVASTVRQMERRPDFLVSRLAAYINAAGGTADLIVNVNGKTIKFRVVE
ncbi:hypothetical protein [Mycobacterium phage WXIN]|nr:hypothetical protein [Mycobacterium phage WXIN]